MKSYGEKPLRKQDMILSVEKTRLELEECIDYENKRSNIDSAKKKAVLYGYDYEGFRQMVLGAHLFGIKSNDLLKFSEGNIGGQGQKKTVFNSEHTTFNNVKDLTMLDQQQTLEFNMMIAQQLANKEIKSKNFREFRKNFDQHYKEQLDEVSAQTLIIKAQDPENQKKIFAMDFDICYFIKILNVLEYVLDNAIIVHKNELEMEFIITFLNDVSKIKDFQFSIPGFLSKSEKEKLKNFILKCEETVKTHFQDKISKEDVHSLVSYYIK